MKPQSENEIQRRGTNETTNTTRKNAITHGFLFVCKFNLSTENSVGNAIILGKRKNAEK